MKGLILKPFTDKYTSQYHERGQIVEFSDVRIKELAALGFVECKDAEEVKPTKKAVTKRAKK